MTRRPLAPAIAAVLLGYVAVAAQSPETVRFCAAADNAPMSVAGPPRGVDVDVARALAGQLGAGAEFVWIGGAARETPPSLTDPIREGRCDAALGAIIPEQPMPTSGTLPTGIRVTIPYHEIGYTLVRAADAAPARTLDDVGAARIGVEREGITNLLLRQRGRKIYVLEDAESIVTAIADREIAYGYLWGPIAAWELRDRTDVAVAPEFTPVDRWGVGLAVAAEGSLLARLDSAIARLREEGVISRILATHGIQGIGRGMAPNDG